MNPVLLLALLTAADPANSGMMGVWGGDVPCYAEPLRPTGTTRYFCDCQAGAQPGCVAGDDSTGAGTAAAPWQSWSKVAATWSSMTGGDTIALCQGGSWTGATNLGPKASCNATGWSGFGSASGTCDLRDYPVPGQTAKPKVAMGSNGLWTWNTDSSSTRYEGYRVLNIDFSLPFANWIDDVNHDLVFLYGNQGYLEVCNVTSDGFQSTLRVNGADLGKNDHIVIRDSAIQNNTSVCAIFGADHVSILNNAFTNCGYLGDNRVHAIYVGGQYCSGAVCVTQGTRIAGNTIYKSVVNTGANASYPPQSGATGQCAGSPIVIHGQHDSLTIEDNTIEEDPGTASDGCWGIDMSWGGYPTPMLFTNVIIRRNKLLYLGGVSIGAAGDGTIVENNLVVNGRGGVGIAAPRDPDSANMTGSTAFNRAIVRNNTVYYTTAGSGRAIDFENNVAGVGHVVASNAVAFAAAGSTPCFYLPAPSTAYSVAEQNACYQGSWGTTSGLILGAITGNPLFTNPALPDFSLQAGSPLGTGGSTQAVGHAADDNMQRIRGTTPGIGAYAP